MKKFMKQLTALLFILALGTSAYGSTTFNPSGDIELGVDIYDFNESSKHKDYYEPYVRYNIYPIEGSSLFISGRSSYRDQYNSSGDYTNDKRERHQAYLGYQWSFGKLTIEPAIGFRVENFEDSKIDERNELRLVPIMSYRFNRRLQWYFGGYFGYTDIDGVEVDGQGRVVEEYSNQRTRNIATGFRYRPTNRLRIDAGVQNQKRQEWAGQYFGTFYRGRINYDIFRNRRWRFVANAEAAYFPEVEISKHGHTEEDEMAYKLGFTLQRELTQNLDLIGRFYYQWRQQNEPGSGGGSGGDGQGGSGGGSGGGGNGGGGNQNSGSGPKRFTEHQQFYSLAIRYYF